MPDNNESKHLQNLSDAEKQVQKLYSDANFELAYFVKATFKGSAKYATSPLYLKKLKEVETKLHDGIVKLLGAGAEQADALSAAKIAETIKTIEATHEALKTVFAKEFATSSGSATAFFAQRKKEGFDISSRVWEITGQRAAEMTDAVQYAIDNGTAAAEMAKVLTPYLKNPDKVFRRVRDDNGNLVESQARKNYHPGQGIYKNSQANAFRLSRTEINGAYRMADQQRWLQQDFVIGYRVSLSNNSKHCDFCEKMQGIYPKTFKWFAFHPSCRCSCTPILMNNEQLDKLEDYLLGIGDKPEVNYVDSIPANATAFIKENADRINGWKSLPYWVTQNPGFINDLLKK